MDAEKLQHRGDSLLLRGTMKGSSVVLSGVMKASFTVLSGTMKGSSYAKDCKVETVSMCKV